MKRRRRASQHTDEVDWVSQQSHNLVMIQWTYSVKRSMLARSGRDSASSSTVPLVEHSWHCSGSRLSGPGACQCTKIAAFMIIIAIVVVVHSSVEWAISDCFGAFYCK